MIALSRRRAILVAAVLLSITTLIIAARTTDYDAEVLQYVSGKINEIKGSYPLKTPPDDERRPDETVTQSSPDSVAVEPSPVISVAPTSPILSAAPSSPETYHDNDASSSSDGDALQSNPFPNLSTTIDVPKELSYNVAGPRSSQIAILTATDGKGHNRDIANLTELIVENRDAYAKHHGYVHHFVDIAKYDLRDVSSVWKKIPAVVETFRLYPDVQWVFWIDADAIIMTPTQDLQSLILSKEGMRKQLLLGESLITETENDLDLKSPSELDFEAVDLIIAQDWNGINAGTFLLRRSQFTQFLLDIWADPLFMYSPFERLEQDALRHMLKHHPTVRQHVGIAKQRSINAYPEAHDEKPNVKWQQGDLLVHFAGCWVYGTCQSSWDEIWPQRGRIP